ncbi:MAG: aldo/keto reductase [Bacteroidales bacterium]|nr:aldo/keto reductase [Bacteroidales bacterium]
MEYKKLGARGPVVSTVGFGAWGISGRDWGTTDDDKSREAEKVLFPMAQRFGTGVIVRIPLLFGLLSGKFSADARFGDNDHRRFNLSPEKLESYITDLKRYLPLFDEYPHHSMVQMSLRFCIAHPACHTVIPGGKTPEQVRENVVASDLSFIAREKFIF